jgi:hypothetical protein
VFPTNISKTITAKHRIRRGAIFSLLMRESMFS